MKELELECLSKYSRVVDHMSLLRKKVNPSFLSSYSDRNCKHPYCGDVILIMTCMNQSEDTEIVQGCSWFYSVGLPGLCFSL